MGAVLNVVNVLGWGAILALICSKYMSHHREFEKQDLTLEVGLVTLMQTFQILDIVMILIGKSKGSLFGSIAQITGRIIVAWIFM